MSPPPPRASVGASAALMGLGKGLTSLLRFVTVPILARTLTPEDFGVAGVALAVVALGLLLGGGSGFGAAITYYRGRGRAFDDTAFCGTLALGLTIAGLIFAFAAPLAALLGAPAAAAPLRMVALILPIDILSGVGFALLAREMRFRAITLAQLAASALSALAAVALALAGFGLWALIWQYALFALGRTISFLALARYRPGGAGEWPIFREIFAYSSRVTLADLLAWVSREGPFVVTAQLLGVAAGGIYRVSDRLTSLPREVIGDSISAAAFPAMVGLGRDDAGNSLLLQCKVTCLLLLPAYLGIAALAEPVTRVVLGPQYADSWGVVALLALGAAAMALSNGMSPYLKSRGRGSAILWLSTARMLLVLLGALGAGLATGSLLGLCLGVALGKLAGSLLFWGWMVRAEGMRPARIVTALGPGLLIATAMALAVAATLAFAMPGLSAATQFTLGTLLGVALFTVLLFTFARSDAALLLRLIARQRRKAGQDA